MKTENLLGIRGITPLSYTVSREIRGVYCGEMPGEALGKLKSGDVWITACANLNTLAVAYQKDASCVIIADNIKTDDEFDETAVKHGVTVFKSIMPVFETAAAVYDSDRAFFIKSSVERSPERL